MKKGRTGLRLAESCLLIAVIYSALLFSLKPAFDLSSWVLYGFTMLSFVIMIFLGLMRMGRMAALQIPQIAATLLYFVIQFVLGGIIMMTREQLPFTPVVVAEIIWTASFLVLSLVMGITRNHAYTRDHIDEKAIMDDRQLVIRLHVLSSKLPTVELKQHVIAVSDTLRYAFPAGNSTPKGLQERIQTTVSMLEEAVDDHDGEMAIKYADNLKRLIEERGLRTKMYAK